MNIITLDPMDAIALHAVAKALENLQFPSENLLEQIHQVGEALATNQSDGITKLRQLSQHESLRELYREARIELQKQDLEQELTLGVPPSPSSELPPQPVYLSNATADIEALKNYQSPTSKNQPDPKPKLEPNQPISEQSMRPC